MSEYNEDTKKQLKILDKASNTGKNAFKIAFGANLISVLAIILISLRIFALYAVIICLVSLVVSFLAYAVLLFDLFRFHRRNK